MFNPPKWSLKRTRRHCRNFEALSVARTIEKRRNPLHTPLQMHKIFIWPFSPSWPLSSLLKVILSITFKMIKFKCCKSDMYTCSNGWKLYDMNELECQCSESESWCPQIGGAVVPTFTLQSLGLSSKHPWPARQHKWRQSKDDHEMLCKQQIILLIWTLSNLLVAFCELWQ